MEEEEEDAAESEAEASESCDRTPLGFSCDESSLSIFPKSGTESISSLEEELQLYRPGAVGTAIIGDVNVHSKRWLKFSFGETPEGTMLHDVCLTAGLKQMVKEATREENLLDLVMTDIPETEIVVGGKVQDHKFVLTKFNFIVPETKTLQREVWNYTSQNPSILCA